MLKNSAWCASAAWSAPSVSPGRTLVTAMSKLAVLGGAPVRTRAWPQWPSWDDAERTRINAVLDSGAWWSTEGHEVKSFENEWADYTQTRHTIAVTNGTHALELALLGCGVGAGDEAIVTAYTFFASASAVATVNAIPVLVDVDPATFCIDPVAVEAAITARTKAVIAVHLAGHPADLDRLTDLCTRHGLALIEDCAHAHGSRWRDRPVGGFGAAGTWSFQQSKLMTAGEGGAVTVQDASLAARVRSLSDCGRQPGEWFYSHYTLGGNFRMTEWQGAVLRAQLARFEAQNSNRNENACYLNDALRSIPGVTPQARDARATSQGYYCYVLRIDEHQFGLSRDAVREALVAEGIPLTMSYPTVQSLHAFRSDAGFAPRHRSRQGWPDYAKANLPVATDCAATTLWCRHALLMGTKHDAQDLVEALQKVYDHRDELRR
jgi:dTDP-4-amino-4,6-dideoxygalactose transaminase